MTRASDTAKLLGAGATILDGTTISTADNTDTLTLTSTDADANTGPNLVLQRDSASPADNDLSGTIKFIADNDAGEATNCVSMFSRIQDASDGTEDASLLVNSIVGGSQISRFNITPTEIAINEDSIDLDFRVEGNGNANVLFVEGETDRVAIGHNDPSQLLDVRGTGVVGVGIGSTNAGGVQLILDGDSNGDFSGSDYCVIKHDNAGRLDIIQDSPSGTNQIRFFTAGTSERMRLGVGLGLGTDATYAKLMINQDTQALNMITLFNTNSTHGGNFVSFLRSTGVAIGSINQNSAAGIVYNTSSDYRLKENVSYSFDATTRLKQLKPARFNWISDDTNTLQDGFLAHEVSSIVPEAITGSKDATKTEQGIVKDASGNIIAQNITETIWETGKEEETYAGNTTWSAEATVPDYQQIDHSKLVPLLTKTILELEARITALES